VGRCAASVVLPLTSGARGTVKVPSVHTLALTSSRLTRAYVFEEKEAQSRCNTPFIAADPFRLSSISDKSSDGEAAPVNTWGKSN
jgi:hypothetical protein